MIRSSLLVAFLFVAGCSSDSGEAVCKRFKELCNQSGGTVTVNVTCDEDKVDEASNAEDVESCVNKAQDCNAATSCMMTLKQ